VQPRGQCLAGDLVVVEGVGEDVDEGGEVVGGNGHATILPAPAGSALDRSCAGSAGDEAADRGIQVAPVVASYDGLHHLGSAGRGGQRGTQLLAVVDAAVGGAAGPAQRGKVRVVRRGEQGLEG